MGCLARNKPFDFDAQSDPDPDAGTFYAERTNCKHFTRSTALAEDCGHRAVVISAVILRSVCDIAINIQMQKAVSTTDLGSSW